MIDNNIIQSLGAGSGIDTQNLVSQLVDIERSAPQQRIDTKRELAETRISDFGLLSSALSTLKDAAALLTDPEALSSKTASFTESTALVPVELDTDVQPGSYSFNVSQIAKSHTLAFGGFSDPTDSVGEGTLTFNFGAWSRDGTTGAIDGAFTQDTDAESATVTIDSENNTLEGLRDAINDADMGVAASIIFDGSNYNLSIVAESGEQNELEISVVESGTAGLASFEFIEGTTSSDAQGGQNAILTLNGIAIERSSNTITDIVDGLTLDVLQEMEASELVTITVSEDKAFAEENVRAFVEAYNTFLEAVDPIFGVTETENDDGETESIEGSLSKDSLAKSLLAQIRSTIASGIPGLGEGETFTALTNIGIRTDLDGSLTIDEDDFSNAFDNNFDAVQKLLAPSTEVSSTSNGTYEGRAFSGLTFPLDTTGSSYTFEIAINGTQSSTLTVPTATYADESELATAIETLINTDTTLSTAGESVTVAFNSTTGGLDITSDGSSSDQVNIVAASTDTNTDLGLVIGSSDITVNSFGTNTQGGEYDIVVTSNPSRGIYEGGAFAGVSFPLDTTGSTYTFEVSVNGTDSEELTIPTATYTSEAELASAIQTLINADTNINEAGASVTVVFDSDSGGFDITSSSYGSSSTVNITASSTDSAADLGLAVASGTVGTAASGRVNGVTGFGSANVLLPALEQPGESLALIIGESATSATVNFSRGFAGELESLIESFLETGGVIATRTETLNDNLESFETDEERLDRRIEAYEARLLNQFIAMESIINSLNTSGSFLDNLINTLPFTASRDS